MTQNEAEIARFTLAVAKAIDPADEPSDGGILVFIDELMRLARRHHRLSERLCNEPGDWDRKLFALEHKIEKLPVQYGFRSFPKLLTQRDPRGSAIRWTRPGNWAGEVHVPQ